MRTGISGRAPHDKFSKARAAQCMAAAESAQLINVLETAMFAQRARSAYLRARAARCRVEIRLRLDVLVYRSTRARTSPGVIKKRSRSRSSADESGCFLPADRAASQAGCGAEEVRRRCTRRVFAARACRRKMRARDRRRATSPETNEGERHVESWNASLIAHFRIRHVQCGCKPDRHQFRFSTALPSASPAPALAVSCGAPPPAG